MEIGVCCGIEYLDPAEKLGFDRIELSFSAVAQMEESAFQSLKEDLARRKIRLESVNCMFPGDMPPLFEEGGLAAARSYLSAAMARLKALGVTTAVVGSGGYRRIPEGLPREEGRARLRALLTVIEEEARKNGITAALEPLNRSETNAILTTREAMEYILELQKPNLKLLVDLYHFCREGESLERIGEFAPYIHHVHIAQPDSRDFLRPGDTYDYRAFFAALRAAGYAGAVMFEGGKGAYLPGLTQMYPLLRQLSEGM